MSATSALGPRLLSAIPYLAPNARVADIGTDHAYLPIHLIREGLASQCLACDINRGPIESARANIASAGLTPKIGTLHTDGLHGVEAFSPDHILIFGMGGELIRQILSDAPWIKSPSVTLVLQPMSRAHLLRAWLEEFGFCIFGETVTYEDKYYQTIAARYGGTPEAPYTTEELYLGRRNLEAPTEHFKGFLQHEIGVLEAILRGKAQAASADTRAEKDLLRTFKTRLETLS